MPNHILTIDTLDDMLEDVSTIKLNTYIRMVKERDNIGD